MVSEIHGLGSLEVRVAGHRPVGMALGELVEPRHQPHGQPPRQPGVVAHVEGDVGGHLVVSRASGVQLAAERSHELGQASLDRHVNVLVVGLERERAVLDLVGHGRESLVDLIELIRVEDAGGMESARVRPRLLEVVRREAPIEPDRGIEALEQRVGRVAKA